MKTIILTLLCAIILSLGSSAQNNVTKNERMRERLTEAKLRQIRFNLELDQATYDKLRPIYLRNEAELAGIDFRKGGGLMRVNADSISSEEAHQLIVNQTYNTKKLIEIREKYYNEYITILKPEQVIKLYQTENEFRSKLANEMKRRKMKRF